MHIRGLSPHEGRVSLSGELEIGHLNGEYLTASSSQTIDKSFETEAHGVGEAPCEIGFRDPEPGSVHLFKPKLVSA
jgi:hypothetical protein